jgi:hypothetical protein
MVYAPLKRVELVNENVGELIVPVTVDQLDVALSHRSIFAGLPVTSAGLYVYDCVTLYADENPVVVTFQ